MSTTITLLLDLWRHVGPGLLLAFALPVLLMALGLVLLTVFRRMRTQTDNA
jgi:hypothetical protein